MELVGLADSVQVSLKVNGHLASFYIRHMKWVGLYSYAIMTAELPLMLYTFPCCHNSAYSFDCRLSRFLPVVKSGWFIGCFAEISTEETDIVSHLSLVCNALSLLRAVVRSAEVLRQLCLSPSCKPIVAVAFISLTDLLVVVHCCLIPVY